MSQNNSNEKSASMELIKKINEVQGFNPELFAVEYTDLATGEIRKRLPVMVQMAWFRMVYPEGKIALQVHPAKDCFIAAAKIYASYKDPVECYISEATASRSYQADKPTVSPREWSQTAAVGIALRNAGFGLQFDMAGDEFETSVAEGESIIKETNNSLLSDEELQTKATSASIQQNEYEADNVPAKELTPEEKYAEALKMPCPIKKFRGEPLSEVLIKEPGAINWLAEKYTGDDAVKAAANVIREYALQASAV